MVKDYLHNKFKHGIEAGKLQYGVGQETTSAEVAEILATSNFDWLFVDGEHGSHTVTSILDIARAIAAYDMTPVVRIPQAGTGIIKQLLDGGIQNIIIPKVETGEETENIMLLTRHAEIAASVRRPCVRDVSIVTPTISPATSKKFVSCRRLKACAVTKIWRQSRTRPASAEFSWGLLTWQSTWDTALTFSTPKLKRQWTT